MSRLLFVALGLVAVVAGWYARTGRWRSWAHPYSGAGLMPLVLLPLGVTLIVFSIADPNDRELPAWQVLIMLLGLPGVFLFMYAGLGMFIHIKRVPDFLRPRWLPPGWEAPRFVDPRGLAIASVASGSVKVPSVVAAEEVLAEAGNAVARWEIMHVDDDPAVPYLHLMLPGWRFCYLYLHDDLVVVAQHKREDRLRGAPFLLVLQPGDVHSMTFIPAPRWSWRMFFHHRTHFPVPRLILETESGPHHLAMFDARFRRHIDRNLSLLEQVLKVPVRR